MKILKKPEYADDWKYQYTCNECDCLLEVEESDLSYYSSQREGDTFTVICVACSSKHIICNDDVPKYVKRMVAKRQSASNYYDR